MNLDDLERLEERGRSDQEAAEARSRRALDRARDDRNRPGQPLERDEYGEDGSPEPYQAEGPRPGAGCAALLGPLVAVLLFAAPVLMQVFKDFTFGDNQISAEEQELWVAQERAWNQFNRGEFTAARDSFTGLLAAWEKLEQPSPRLGVAALYGLGESQVALNDRSAGIATLQRALQVHVAADLEKDQFYQDLVQRIKELQRLEAVGR